MVYVKEIPGDFCVFWLAAAIIERFSIIWLEEAFLL